MDNKQLNCSSNDSQKSISCAIYISCIETVILLLCQGFYCWVSSGTNDLLASHPLYQPATIKHLINYFIISRPALRRWWNALTQLWVSRTRDGRARVRACASDRVIRIRALCDDQTPLTAAAVGVVAVVVEASGYSLRLSRGQVRANNIP